MIERFDKSHPTYNRLKLDVLHYGLAQKAHFNNTTSAYIQMKESKATSPCLCA